MFPPCWGSPPGSSASCSSTSAGLLLLLPGIAGFLLLLALGWRLQAREEHLELIEVGMLIVMMLANPEPRMEGGRPAVLLFGSVHIGQSQSALLALLPLAGTAAGSMAVAVSRLVGRKRRKRARSSGRRRAVLVFYRQKIPIGLLSASYAFEIPVLLTNPAVTTTVRTVVLVMFGLRVLWFLAFLFRSEQEIGGVVRAPRRPNRRPAFYRPAAAIHGALCVLPPLLYLVRLLLLR